MGGKTRGRGGAGRGGSSRGSSRGSGRGAGRGAGSRADAAIPAGSRNRTAGSKTRGGGGMSGGAGGLREREQQQGQPPGCSVKMVAPPLTTLCRATLDGLLLPSMRPPPLAAQPRPQPHPRPPPVPPPPAPPRPLGTAPPCPACPCAHARFRALPAPPRTRPCCSGWPSAALHPAPRTPHPAPNHPRRAYPPPPLATARTGVVLEGDL